MSKGMVGNIQASAVKGVMGDLLDKLVGPHGEVYLQELRRISELPVAKVNMRALPSIPYGGWQLEQHTVWEDNYIFRGSVDESSLYLYRMPAGMKFSAAYNRGDLNVGEDANVNLRDHLLRFPAMIPSSWQMPRLFFLATVFVTDMGEICVCGMENTSRGWTPCYLKGGEELREGDMMLLLRHPFPD